MHIEDKHMNAQDTLSFREIYDGGDKPMLIYPASSTDARYVTLAATRFAKAGYHVYVLDHYGAMAKKTDVRWKQNKRWPIDAVHTLVDYLNLHNPVLLGDNSGGIVLAKAGKEMTLQGKQIDSFIWICPTNDYKATSVNPLIFELYDSMGRAIIDTFGYTLAKLSLRNIPKQNQLEGRGDLTVLASMMDKSSYKEVRNNSASGKKMIRWTLENELEVMHDVPKLFIHALQDKFVYISKQASFYNHVFGSYTREVMNAPNHAIATQPEVVSTLILGYLNQKG